MKKFFTTLMLCILAVGIVSAQNIDTQRIENLRKLVEKTPKASGIDAIDNYAKAAGDAAMMAINASTQLTALNEQIASNNLPALDQVTALVASIDAEQKAVKEAGEKLIAAKDAFKEIEEKAKSGSMKEKLALAAQVKNGKKCLDFANDAMGMLTPEAAAQATAVAAILSKVKK